MDKIYSTGPVDDLVKQMDRLKQFSNKNRDRYDMLTSREIEILSYIADGLKNPAISEKLGISRITVQNHRSHIRQKLNITNQAEYIRYALAYDLIQL